MNAEVDLKSIFNEEMNEAFSNIDKCLGSNGVEDLHGDCAHILGDVLHKVKGILFQAGLDGVAVVAEKYEKIFEDLARGKAEIDESVLDSLKKDMVLLKGACKAFVDSKEEVVL